MRDEGEIPDFDDRPWDGPFDKEPFAELTDDCKRAPALVVLIDVQNTIRQKA